MNTMREEGLGAPSTGRLPAVCPAVLTAAIKKLNLTEEQLDFLFAGAFGLHLKQCFYLRCWWLSGEVGSASAMSAAAPTRLQVELSG